MTKVVDNQAFPNIALQDPWHGTKNLICVLVVEIKDHSSFKFINQINQHLTRQMHLSR